MTEYEFYNKYPSYMGKGSYTAYKDRYALGHTRFNEFVNNELGGNTQGLAQTNFNFYFTNILYYHPHNICILPRIFAFVRSSRRAM